MCVCVCNLVDQKWIATGRNIGGRDSDLNSISRGHVADTMGCDSRHQGRRSRTDASLRRRVEVAFQNGHLAYFENHFFLAGGSSQQLFLTPIQRVLLYMFVFAVLLIETPFAVIAQLMNQLSTDALASHVGEASLGMGSSIIVLVLLLAVLGLALAIVCAQHKNVPLSYVLCSGSPLFWNPFLSSSRSAKQFESSLPFCAREHPLFLPFHSHGRFNDECGRPRAASSAAAPVHIPTDHDTPEEDVSTQNVNSTSSLPPEQIFPTQSPQPHQSIQHRASRPCSTTTHLQQNSSKSSTNSISKSLGTAVSDNRRERNHHVRDGPLLSSYRNIRESTDANFGILPSATSRELLCQSETSFHVETFPHTPEPPSTPSNTPHDDKAAETLSAADSKTSELSLSSSVCSARSPTSDSSSMTVGCVDSDEDLAHSGPVQTSDVNMLQLHAATCTPLVAKRRRRANSDRRAAFGTDLPALRKGHPVPGLANIPPTSSSVSVPPSASNSPRDYLEDMCRDPLVALMKRSVVPLVSEPLFSPLYFNVEIRNTLRPAALIHMENPSMDELPLSMILSEEGTTEERRRYESFWGSNSLRHG